MNRLLIIVSLLLISTTLSLTGQIIGIGGGFDYGSSWLHPGTVDGVTINQSFRTDIGSPFVFAEVHTSMALGFTLCTRMTWRTSAAAYAAPIPEPEVLLEPYPPGLLIPVEQRISFTTRTIAVEATTRGAISRGFWIAAGPVVGYRTVSKYRYGGYYDRDGWRARIDDRGTISYEWITKGTTILLDSTDHPPQHYLDPGALIVIGGDIAISSALSLAPELRIGYSFSAPIVNADGNCLWGGLGLSMRYQF
jgi:hypothetical protein